MHKSDDPTPPPRLPPEMAMVLREQLLPSLRLPIT
jgi:hypothetical protein